MIMSLMKRWLLLLPLMAGLLPALAHAAPVATEVLVVERGTHRHYRELGPVRRVAIGDPTIADVTLINRSEILLTGKQVGLTSLMVWRESTGTPKAFRLRVVPVQTPEQQARAPDPELTQAVIEPGVALEGRLPNLLAHRRAQQAARGGGEAAVADRSEVTLETQVLTEVKIADVGRSTAQSFGLNLAKLTNFTQLILSPPGAIGELAVGGAGLLPVNDAFQIVVGDPSRGASGVLSLLERKGLAQVLAEPSLLATSGQTATYLVGGEFPVPVSQGSGVAGGGITIEYREFGVRLSLTPTVLSRDRISLKIAPEVSDLDFTNAVQIGGVATPALRVRRTDTTVELGDGESFVISGLISSSANDSVDKVPWLGDLPVIGALFRSARINKEARELIMVVTPNLVRPLSRQAQLPTLPGARERQRQPSFAETFFLETGDFSTGYSD
jgi:pilus assembly protein CpaC